eukprot:TRINITY_DN3117_c0_g1_i6.p1 TRINITY_DN3117_c0_g1~~TRINITY_DN3117_c0_g1_i6.p1  ORF type:complete len:108 (-),score=17.77 TRINITY_DN3117_c0_g1_i6:82-375(-)
MGVADLTRMGEAPAAATSWNSLHLLLRLSQTVSKDLVICQVISPAFTEAQSTDFSFVLTHSSVNLLLAKRWTPETARDMAAGSVARPTSHDSNSKMG